MPRDDEETSERVRLDKWLWAARFFKTRALAAEAIDGGKVEVNDARAKRAKMVQLGDAVRVRQPWPACSVAALAARGETSARRRGQCERACEARAV